MLAAAVLSLTVAIALFAPLLASSDGGVLVSRGPNDVSLAERHLPPGAGHPLGTDELGRDVAARMIHGARVPLVVGVACGTISLLVGGLLGALGGYFGGAVDWIVLRLTETVLCFPFLFLALALAGFFDPSVTVVIAAVVLVSWPAEARIVRGEVIRLRGTEITSAAVASGAGPLRVVVRHLLPNAIAPAIVSASFGAAGAIAAESALSFLGLGVQPPQASWGAMLFSAQESLRKAWWVGAWPALAIFVTILSIHVLAERARDLGDPRRRAPGAGA